MEEEIKFIKEQEEIIGKFKDKLKNLKYIKDNELLDYLIKPNLLYANFGRMYIRMSAQINEILSEHYNKCMIFQSTRKLREALKEILMVEGFINERDPNLYKRTNEGRHTITNNKNIYMGSKEYYTTIIQNIENNKFSIIAIFISISAIIISILAIAT